MAVIQDAGLEPRVLYPALFPFLRFLYWSGIPQLQQHIVPVLFLTARDAVEDRVKGLEFGADDYLVKPFTFFELLARVRSVLCRGAVRQPETLQIADSAWRHDQ